MQITKYDDLVGVAKNLVELKVRASDDDYNYYLFPREKVAKTIECINKAGIYFDEISADSWHIESVPVYESKIDVGPYDESECVALNCKIDINELYEIIEYVDSHPDGLIRIVLFKNSELPEFREILNTDKAKDLAPEVQIALCEYMKMLLDLDNGSRWVKVGEFMEQGDFAKLLELYSDNVYEFILAKVSARTAAELKRK